MKNWVIILTLIIIAVAFMIMLRFDVDVQSPVVSKLDRWTGKVWVANGGIWMPIKGECETKSTTCDTKQK